MDPAGVFARNYGQDRRLIRTRYQWLALGLFMAALVVAPLVIGDRPVVVLSAMMIWAVAAVGLQINLGYAGQINLGQAAFMGVGAYTVGFLSTKLDIAFWLAIPLAGFMAAAFGFLFGLTAARIKGFYLALTTVAAQFIFHFLILALPATWFGSSNGIDVPAPSLLGYPLITDTALYYVILVFAVLMIAGAFGIIRSRYGRAFIAVRDDDVAAGMMGVNVAATKAFAFLVGTFYAGVAGGLWAYFIRFIAVDQFTLFSSIWIVGMLIVGGMGSIVGAIIGVVIIRSIQELISSFGPDLVQAFPMLGSETVFASYSLVLGGLIAVFLLLEPKGLMHRWNMIKSAHRIWPFPH